MLPPRAWWIKRTTPGPSLHSALTPSRLRLGRSPRTTIDMLVPQSGDTEAKGGLTISNKNRPRNVSEFAKAPNMNSEIRETTTQRRNVRQCGRRLA